MTKAGGIFHFADRVSGYCQHNILADAQISFAKKNPKITSDLGFFQLFKGEAFLP